MYARARTNSFLMVSICNMTSVKEILVDGKLSVHYITVDPLKCGKQKEQLHSS